MLIDDGCGKMLEKNCRKLRVTKGLSEPSADEDLKYSQLSNFK